MRRLPVLTVLLALSMLASPLAAFAEAGPSGAVVLAADSEPVGPEPADREAEDNPARTMAGYEDPDLPYTWGAAWLLAFAGLVGLVALGGLYQLLVRGPAQRSES